MTVFTKRALSGSTNGRMIKVVQTATAGTLIHTAVSGTTEFDEVWLYAMNNHSSNVNLTIEFGGVSSPDDLIKMAIPYQAGLYLVVPGWVIQNGLAVRAFASVANVISMGGWVNRIT